MSRLTIIVCIMVCMALAAGCGSKGSSSGTAVVPKYSNFSSFRTMSGTLIGGAVQKGPFAFKYGSYSTVTAPIFTLMSSAFNAPIAVTTDGTTHYVANFLSHNIFKIDSNGVVTRYAGSGLAGFANSSTARPLTASFYYPAAITADSTTLYVADSGNHVIRKIEADGRVSLLAGIAGTAGSDDTSLGVVARFNQPTGITAAGGVLFVSDTGNHAIRMVDTTTGAVTTLAGSPGSLGSSDGDRISARFNQPARITFDGANLYVSDFGNKVIRKISIPAGKVETIAGVAGNSGTTDGPRGRSLFNQPNGIVTDGINLYVTDSYEGTVRRVKLPAPGNLYGTYSTTTVRSGLKTPIGITTNGSGLYVAERNANGIVRIK